MKTLQAFQHEYYRFRYDNRIPFERNGMRLLPVDLKRDGENFTPHGMVVGNGPIDNEKTEVSVAQVCALVPALTMPVVVKTENGKQTFYSDCAEILPKWGLDTFAERMVNEFGDPKKGDFDGLFEFNVSTIRYVGPGAASDLCTRSWTLDIAGHDGMFTDIAGKDGGNHLFRLSRGENKHKNWSDITDADVDRVISQLHEFIEVHTGKWNAKRIYTHLEDTLGEFFIINDDGVAFIPAIRLALARRRSLASPVIVSASGFAVVPCDKNGENEDAIVGVALDKFCDADYIALFNYVKNTLATAFAYLASTIKRNEPTIDSQLVKKEAKD